MLIYHRICILRAQYTLKSRENFEPKRLLDRTNFEPATLSEVWMNDYVTHLVIS